MKKISVLIISLLAIFALLLGALLIFTPEEQDLYKIATKIKYDEIFDDKEGKNYYYFYQDSCSHCKELKPAITDFYLDLPEEENFYLIDMTLNDNTEIWYDWSAHDEKYGSNTPAEVNPNYISDPSKMLTLDDIKVTGTPTMIVTEDGVVTGYEVGNENIEALIGVKS